MKIEVTKGHIDAGQPNTMNECPIALAIREQLDDRLRVGSNSLKIMSVDPVFTMKSIWRWPERVANWITTFDNDGKVEPISFNVPESVVKQIRKLTKERGDTGGKAKTKKSKR